MTRAAAGLVVILALLTPAPSLGDEQAAAAIPGDRAESVPPAVGGAYACDAAGAAGQVKGGGVAISIPTYPCEVARTFQTLDELDRRGGFLAGTAKVFLKVRLVTRGVFSAFFGLFGLG